MRLANGSAPLRLWGLGRHCLPSDSDGSASTAPGGTALLGRRGRTARVDSDEGGGHRGVTGPVTGGHGQTPARDSNAARRGSEAHSELGATSGRNVFWSINLKCIIVKG